MAGGSRTTTTEPWAEQKPYLTQGFKTAESLYIDPATGAPRTSPYYAGPTLAGPDLATQTAQRGKLGYALGPRPQALQGAAEASMVRGLSGAFNTAVLDPVVQSYQDQMMSKLQGQTLPGIRESLVDYNPGGSARGNVIQSNAIAAAQRDLQARTAQLYGGAYEAAQQRVPQFQQLYPQTMGAPFGLMDQVGDVGAERRAQAQEAINRDIAKYTYEQQAPQAALQNYMASISGDYGSTTTAPGPSGIQSLGQILGVAAPLLGWSDERLKDNIIKIGSFNGLNIYEFNYIWSPVKFVGVIAQEIEKVLPEAVKTFFGYKAVDYRKLGIGL